MLVTFFRHDWGQTKFVSIGGLDLILIPKKCGQLSTVHDKIGMYVNLGNRILHSFAKLINIIVDRNWL